MSLQEDSMDEVIVQLIERGLLPREGASYEDAAEVVLALLRAHRVLLEVCDQMLIEEQLDYRIPGLPFYNVRNAVNRARELSA
jgi:hypothetical protein